MPVFNGEKYIYQTLQCLCNQTYTGIEIIVVNDGSVDGTGLEVDKVKDKRITLINVENGGAAKSRNIAWQHAKGAYIIFLDADDYLPPAFIASQLDKIKNKQNTVVLAQWGRFYDDDINTFKLNGVPESGEMTFKDWIKSYWYNGNPMTNPGRVMIPSALVQQAGLWDERLSLNDDLEFFTRIFLKSDKIIFNNDVDFYYRSGIGGLSSKKSYPAYQSLYNSIALSVNYVLSICGSCLFIQYTRSTQTWCSKRN
jgi:glycosyltransferase involved in cell wall biosynthesis